MTTLSECKQRALAVLTRIGDPVLTVGSLNADLIVATERLPLPGETVTGGDLRILPGGKSSNQAAASALLGAKTAIIGALGRDGNGELLVRSLEDKGVLTHRIKRCDVPTGTAIITVDAQAENCIVISPGANACLKPVDIEKNEDAFEHARVLGLCFEVGMPTIQKAAELAHAHNVTCVLNVSPVQKVPAELLELVDILIVNEHELAVVCGEAVDPRDEGVLVAAFERMGISRAVVTLGGAGSLIIDAGQVYHIPAFPVHPIDTTGAGDSFMGALMAGIAADAPLADAAILASAVSAYATIRVGAQSSYASANEIRGYLDTLS